MHRQAEMGWSGVSDGEAAGAWDLSVFIICIERRGGVIAHS